MTDCKALLTLKQNANFKSRMLCLEQCLRSCVLSRLSLSMPRIDFSHLESKSLEYSLESDFDCCGSGFLSVALTEEQEAEAKGLYRVLFLVLQDPDALKTLSFDQITKKKVRSYLKHVHLEEHGSTIFVTLLGEDHIFPKFEDRENIIKETHCNAHFPMRPTLDMIQKTYW